MTSVRTEVFGAWVGLDDGSLVAIDRSRARSLGIDGGDAWDDTQSHPAPFPLEAHVGVTSECPVACSGCYQDASPSGSPVPHEQLLGTLDSLAAARVFTVAFGGGEPLTVPSLGALAQEARARGLTPVFTTSGLGLTADRVDELRGFAQINVSHDGVSGAYRSVRGFDGASHADRAIQLLVAAGIPVGVNVVLTRESFAHVEATAAHVQRLGAIEMQLLRYKPAGRAASLTYLARRLDAEQIEAVHPLLERLAHTHAGALSIRIDCAMVPFLSPHVREARALSRWGVFGCEAGRHLVAVTQGGSLGPCSFHRSGPASDPNFAHAWHTDATLERFRAFVEAPPAPCRDCPLQSVCRGGCKVVSEHLTGTFVSDPECPTVRAHHG